MGRLYRDQLAVWCQKDSLSVMNKLTLILGASPKEERYSNMAQKALVAAGHTVIPCHPGGGVIDGVEVVAKPSVVEQNVDTVTVYVRPEIFQGVAEEVIDLHPQRVIFNPGTEDGDLECRLETAGIEVLRACTLVMLQTGQF